MSPSTSPFRPTLRLLSLASALAVLTGCASLSPDGNHTEMTQFTQGKTAGVSARIGRQDDAATRQAVNDLLKDPVTAESAVRVALLNNPGLHAAMATLGISDAARVQAGTLPNPHFALGRLVQGQEVEIERALSFNVLGLLTLPWRAQWQSQQHEIAKLEAAQSVIQLAANTRKAWINAVAAQQTAAYMLEAKEAAQASAELARRMVRAGNWSRLNQAREQSFLNEATAQLARAQHNAVAEREKLTRLMGLWGEQTRFTLAERLPDLPAAATDVQNVEAQALRQRLDVRSKVAESAYVAGSLGLTRATGFINALDLTYSRNTTFDNASGERATQRGWELELPLPIFDWGGSSRAKAESVYLQSVARLRETAVNARSEARQTYHAYRTAYDLARHYRDDVVPLRRFINDEMVLRYNGMLIGVFELLNETRASIAAVNTSIEAQRDFWLAETDLQTTLTGTSAGAGMALGKSSGAAESASAAAH